MEKTRRNIYLPKYIDEDIRKRNEIYGFTFSEWVVQKYKDELMSTDLIDQQIYELEEKKKKLQELKVNVQQKEETFKEAISRQEKRFLKDVPRLKREFDLKAIWRRFNHTFDREISFKRFEHWVKYYEEQSKRKDA